MIGLLVTGKFVLLTFAIGFVMGGFFFDSLFHPQRCAYPADVPLILHPQAVPR